MLFGKCQIFCITILIYVIKKVNGYVMCSVTVSLQVTIFTVTLLGCACAANYEGGYGRVGGETVEGGYGGGANGGYGRGQNVSIIAKL